MYQSPEPRGFWARFGSFIRRRPLLSGAVAAAVIGLGSYLFFGFFAFHLLFVDSTVSEENPFAAPAVTTVAPPQITTAPAPPEESAAPTPTTTPPTTVAPATTAPQVVELARGEFTSLAHPTSGTAIVITDGDRTFLRFEGFETDNGPDLNVYLGTGPADGDPGEFIDLGDLKGNIGDQNYEVPAGVDLDRYGTVFVWCVRFSVGFGAAALA